MRHSLGLIRRRVALTPVGSRRLGLVCIEGRMSLASLVYASILKRGSESPMSETGQFVLICPTPEGGHIEHAYDLALSLANLTQTRQTLLSRPGAKAYLPSSQGHLVRIVEWIPSLPPTSTNKYVQVGRFSLALVTEHLRIIGLLWKLGPGTVLIVEEPRYPMPRLFHYLGRASRIVAFVHNAVDHDLVQRSAKDVIRKRIALSFYRRVDALAVHGPRQAETVRNEFSRPTKSFVLPGSSRISAPRTVESPSSLHPLTFVCLGELRQNKGLELAIAAAKLAQVRLVVVGRSIDDEYTETLVKLAADAETVEVRVRFLEPSEFQSYISDSAALVLPYTHFEAQSGVVARAISANVHLFLSDLPSLLEQVADYPNVTVSECGSVDSLARKLREFADNPPTMNRNINNGDDDQFDEWSQIASAIHSGW
jgi:glycosyltransferase involved in cell wall biosynthesis